MDHNITTSISSSFYDDSLSMSSGDMYTGLRTDIYTSLHASLHTSLHTSLHDPFHPSLDTSDDPDDLAYADLATSGAARPTPATCQSPDVLLGAEFRIAYSSPPALNLRCRARRRRAEGLEEGVGFAGFDSTEDEEAESAFDVNSLLDKQIRSDRTSSRDESTHSPFSS